MKLMADNKKVLVTGAGGFIGSHLTELFVNEGFNVKAFIRYNSKNNWGWLENHLLKMKLKLLPEISEIMILFIMH